MPIRMENGIMSWVLMLKGSKSLTTSTVSAGSKLFRYVPVVCPTNMAGMVIPVEFLADMCSERKERKGESFRKLMNINFKQSIGLRNREINSNRIKKINLW